MASRVTSADTRRELRTGTDQPPARARPAPPPRDEPPPDADDAAESERILRAAQARINALTAELDALGPVSSDAELAAEAESIRKVRDAWAVHRASVERAEKLRARHAPAVAHEAAQRARLDRLKALERGMLDGMRSLLEGPMSAACGAEIKIDLENGACRILRDGIDVSAISDGETLRLLGGILIALAPTSDAEWRPLFLDRIEAVSGDGRGAFLESIAVAARGGVIDQAIVAGCPDAPGGAPGWTVVALDRGAP